MKAYIFYCDPGHSWLRVKIAELEQLNIDDKISSHSYMRGNFAYLEEDCDASIFIQAKFGNDVKSRELEEQGLIKTQLNNSTTIREFEYYHIRTKKEAGLMSKVISHLLTMDFRASAKKKIKNADYTSCQHWQKYYSIAV